MLNLALLMLKTFIKVTFNTVLFLLIWFEEAFVCFIRIDFKNMN